MRDGTILSFEGMLFSNVKSNLIRWILEGPMAEWGREEEEGEADR
jgi:hypothetical protein